MREVEPLLAPGAAHRSHGTELEDTPWEPDGGTRAPRAVWLRTRRFGVVFGLVALVTAVGMLALFSPALIEHGAVPSPPAAVHSAPPGRNPSGQAQDAHALHSVHAAHQSALHGSRGLFTADASSAALIDRSVGACDDFYEHACGAFAMQPLPSDHDEWFYAFSGVKARVAQTMRKVLSSESGPAGLLYRSCIDENAIERAGEEPLTKLLLEFQMRIAADNLTASQRLVHTVATLHRINAKAFFFWNVGADADSPTQVMYMEQGGLTLPSHGYYSSTDPESQAKVRALHTFVARVFTLLGHEHDEAEEAAASVVEVETALSKLFLTHAQEREANSLPPLSFKQVAKGMATNGSNGGFDWLEFFRLLGVPHALLASDTKVVRVLDVRFFKMLCSWLAEKPAGYFDHYLRWNFLDALSGHLGRDFQHADLLFRKALYGVKKDPPRWRICLHTLNSFVPVTVGAVFKDATFQEDSALARDAHELLKLLRAAFQKIIASAQWMSPSSRAVAQQKLSLMDFQVGGSDRVAPLPWVVSKHDGWFNNSVLMAKALVSHQVQKLGSSEARDDWGQQLGPMSVNAFYNVHENTLFLPAAMLQEPFFPRHASHPPASSSAPPVPTTPAHGTIATSLDARAFGSIGALLGHEMSHGFDNVGRLFGPAFKDGHVVTVLRSWWDPATKAQYKHRAECVGRYYHSFDDGGRHVDGNNTLGEDIADKGGLHVAYEAMLTYVAAHKSTPHLSAGRGGDTEADGLVDEKRRFFEAWAQTWCHMSTPKMKRDALLTDPHAPSRVRVNAALSQFPPFRDTFQCPDSSKMAPPLRPQCSLW